MPYIHPSTFKGDSSNVLSEQAAHICCVGVCDYAKCKELVYENDYTDNGELGHSLQAFRFCPECGKENN